MVEKTMIKIARKFVEALKRAGIKVDKVVLYSSYTQGRQRTDSDIDIAIISRDFGDNPMEEGMNLFRIAGLIDPRIEPVPISLISYENDTWIPLIYEIRENGVDLESLAVDELANN
ncbi:MAG: nucleotidyltransferase domain-containing protein [bacterium]|nr:MAG: nucleotidyltransferase domain-containing protein [bacterium]